MLVFVPVLVLVGTGLAVLVMRQAKVSIGYIWLSALAGSFVAWLVLLVVNWDNTPVYTSQFWNLPGSMGYPVGFGFDRLSWPFAFALSSLLLAVLLTSTVRFHFQSDPFTWAFSVLIGAAGILAAAANTPLAFVFSWTVVDILEIAMLGLVGGGKALQQRNIISSMARIGGIFLVLWAMVSSRSEGLVLNLGLAAPPQSVLLLLAAALRLGVVPLHVAYTSEPLTRRGLGTMLRLVPPAASLVLLSRLPAAVVPPNAAVAVLLFCILAAGYGAFMWMVTQDDLEGRPYWLLAVAGLAIASGVRGQPEAIPVMGTAMVLVGGLIFLSSEFRKPLSVILLVGFIGLTALPYTPAAGSLTGLTVYPFNLLDVFFILVFAVLLSGTFFHMYRKREEQPVERWLLAVYSAGLVVLIASHWLIGFLVLKVEPRPGVWWVSLVSTFLAVLIILAYRWWQRSGLPIFLRNDPRLAAIRKTVQIIADVLRLDWLYALFGLVLRLLQSLIQFLTRLLEGEGGVLWTLLLIVLLASFITMGGSQ
ncbi:MAG: hypothetical protein KBG60_06555 [Anaerolineaceae bacterium]|nr:hypothetical protein [Anaerolineaceae bacterium]